MLRFESENCNPGPCFLSFAVIMAPNFDGMHVRI